MNYAMANNTRRSGVASQDDMDQRSLNLSMRCARHESGKIDGKASMIAESANGDNRIAGQPGERGEISDNQPAKASN